MLDAKVRENAELEAYRPKLAEIERQLASLKQQLEIERRIVPDEKEVDGFMKMLNVEASKAGIEIRRYTAQPVAAKEFYSEAPFEVELDGPYYSMLGFFDRVAKLERIVNVSNCWSPAPPSRPTPRPNTLTSTHLARAWWPPAWPAHSSARISSPRLLRPRPGERRGLYETDHGKAFLGFGTRSDCGGGVGTKSG